ncbi:MAG: hypothetical protein QOD60_1429 [Solirubrobacterales bacterium]|nr:hypothetical protein [Solirubrobacterales bacterium]
MSEERETRSGLEDALRAPVRAVLDRPSRALTSAVAERVAEVLIEEGVVERIVERALKDPGTERAAIAVLDSELLDEIVERLMAGPEIQRIIERIANAPEVRNAITRQGVGLLDDLRRELGKAARHGDDLLERPFRAVARRGRRQGSTPFGGGVTRAIALGFDAAVVNFTLLATSALVALVVSAVTTKSPSTGGAVAIGASAWIVFSSLYLFSFWTLTGQTPGMRFLGLELRRSDGAKLDGRHAFRRLLGMGLSVLTFGIGFLIALFSERRRGLQDRMGDTVVLYTETSRPELPPVV